MLCFTIYNNKLLINDACFAAIFVFLFFYYYFLFVWFIGWKCTLFNFPNKVYDGKKSRKEKKRSENKAHFFFFRETLYEWKWVLICVCLSVRSVTLILIFFRLRRTTVTQVTINY